MDLIFNTVFKKKQSVSFVEDDNYYNPLKKDVISDLETHYGDLINDDLIINDLIIDDLKKEEPINKVVKLPNPYIDDLKTRYKEEELTDDGLLTIETQIRELKEADERINEYNYNKEMVNRVKCLALHKMNKSILTNTLNMNSRDRASLQNIMHSYNDIPHQDIIDAFNDVVNIEIFEYPKLDYNNLPLYNA